MPDAASALQYIVIAMHFAKHTQYAHTEYATDSFIGAKAELSPSMRTLHAHLTIEQVVFWVYLLN